MSATDTDTEKSLLREEDLSRKTPPHVLTDTFSDMPDIILFGETFRDEDFSEVSKYDSQSEQLGSRASTGKTVYDGFWGPYESYPAFIGETMEGPREQQTEEEEEQEEEEEEEEEEEVSYLAEKKKKVKGVSEFEPRRRSLFVHSSPTHFPDISRARKSVFGSIFVRTTGYVTEEAALLKSVAESNYSMLQSMLSSFDRILSSTSVSSEKKKTALAYRESMMKSLETHGMSRTYSDGTVHWEIYPITQNYLFSIQLGDHVHQTRNLSRIEERIVNGTTQVLRPNFSWPSGSAWSGHWDLLGMAGRGEYFMPHGVSYAGNMQNGMFHDEDATLTYPNKFKALHCVYEKGELLDCQFQFPDKLMHEKVNWGYCQFPDRRFWSEVINGLKPAKIAQKTELDPPRKIPLHCYDTSDGFYNPKTLMLVGPGGELLRVPVCEEDHWIKKYCRKAFSEAVNFRPDLFENWFNYDEKLINSILVQQERFRAGKISYEELQQFYADNELLLTSAKYKKRKTPSQVAIEEFINSIPSPKELKTPRVIKKYHGHDLQIPRNLGASEEPAQNVASIMTHRASKSFQILHLDSEFKPKFSISQSGMPNKGSRISFRPRDGDEDLLDTSSEQTSSSLPVYLRQIPEQFMAHQPIMRLKQPFPDKRKSFKGKETCRRRKSDDISENWDLLPEGGSLSSNSIYKKGLDKFIKKLLMDIVTNFLTNERERHRQRYKWGKKLAPKATPKESTTTENCLKLLQEMFTSIPDREEYSDSDPDKTVYFKKLAEDKYNILKYWGKRMYTLNFSEGLPKDKNEL